MKKILFVFFQLLLFTLSEKLNAQQGDIRRDRVIANQGVFIGPSGSYGRWIDSVQNDTAFISRARSVPTSKAVYDFVNGRVGSIEGGFKVESIAALRASTAYAADKVADVLGYYTKGDPGGGTYFFNASSTATDNDGNIIKPTAISSGDPGRWIRVDEGTIRAATFGITNDLTNQNTKITALSNISAVKEIVFDQGGKIAVDGNLVIPYGKSLHFQNNTMLSGISGGSADTLKGGYIIADIRKWVIDTTLIPVNLENRRVSVMWFGALNDYFFGNATPTNNLTPFRLALGSQKVITDIYMPGTDISSTGPVSTTYHYRFFNGGLTIDKTVNLYGDGRKKTYLLFDGTRYGIKLTGSVGGSHLHDFNLKGTTGSSSVNINSDTAHGIFINSPDNVIQHIDVTGFDGDGFNIAGDVESGGNNANGNAVMFCTSKKNGRAGGYAKGGDGNANSFMHCDFSQNARYGMWDHAFLQNYWLNIRVSSNVHAHNFNKSVIWYKPAVSHNGNRYRLISLGNTNIEPGVHAQSSTYWQLIGAGGVDDTYHAWNSATVYPAKKVYYTIADNTNVEPTITAGWETKWKAAENVFPSFWNEWDHTTAFLGGGSGIVDGDNSRSQFAGCYAEGDQAGFINRGNAIVIGGLMSSSGNYDRSIGADSDGIRMWRAQFIGNTNSTASVYIRKPYIGSGDFITMIDDSTDAYMQLGGTSPTNTTMRFEVKTSGVANFDHYVHMVKTFNLSGSTTAAFRFSARTTTNTDLTNQNTYDFQNNSTSQLLIKANAQLRNSYLVGTGSRLLFTNSTGDIGPLANGSDGQVLTMSGGFPVFATAAGGGNVSNTGTPLINQVAVWNSATVLRGDGNLTWDGSVLNPQISTSGTNSVLYPLKISRFSTATPTTGLGVGMKFEAENASNINKEILSVGAAYTDATNGSEDADVIISPIRNGTLTEALRIGSTGNANFNNGIITGYGVETSNLQTGTAYTLLSTDNGDVVSFNNSSLIFCYVPSGLPAGFNCSIRQLGTGQVEMVALSTTLNSYGGNVKTAGQHAIISVIYQSSNIYTIAGQTGP